MAQRPGRSPMPPPAALGSTSPSRSNAGSRLSGRSSIETDSDTASQYAPQPLNINKRARGYPLPHFVSQQNVSSTSINQVRPSGEMRRMSPSIGIGAALGHRPRQHSQGYFEPSLPSTNLDPSRIAAQAAVQHLNVATQHVRRRSSTVPFNEPEQEPRRNSYGSVSSDGQSPGTGEVQYKNGLVGNNNAATAAQAVWKAPEKEVKKGFRDKFRTKHIGIMKDKGVDKPLQSPNKPTSGLAKVYNASTTSLADMSSNNSSMYNLQNNSVNTIIPIDEKKKHTGLRQKLKLKDKDDFAGQLSSANSNSRPVDINNPQTLYNFAPSSPGHSSGFAKSVSDLRHKKKDKLEQVHSRESDGTEWPTLSTSLPSETATPYSRELKETLAVFGLNNMTPDDAWEFLKARLLVVFEGEHVPIAVEDLNKLLTVHVQRCVAKRDPSMVIGDLENLLHTGFLSLHHTLRGLHDERLVPNLVQMWMEVFGNVLPFMQAVFLPLDQEFKGRGSVLKTPDMAAEFFGALPSSESVGRLSSSPSSQIDDHAVTAAGEELEVRRMLLMSFRDHVILPRFDLLKTTFSRLSLDSINATLAHFQNDSGRARGDSLGRDTDKISSSYSSQTSTLMGTPNRSRATSNLSSGSAQDVAFQSFSSPPAARAGDTSSAQITETVARMLQCLSVLGSVQSGDESQAKVEELTKELKLNWLGRGRTGRNRKGFVGSRQRQVRSIASTIRPEGLGRLRDSREGSPTPTPTRQGTVSRQEGRLVESAA